MRILLMAVCLVACSPAPPVEGPRTQSQAPTQHPAFDDIRGEWRLTEMNGRPAPSATDPDDAHHPITMTVGDFTFRAQSQCVAFWRLYDRQGDRLVVSEANPGAMCARGLSDWETEFSRSLSKATRAERVEETLRLTGPEARLVFEPAPPQPRIDITGRWRLQFFHGAAPPPGSGPVEITISDGRIGANACVFSGWRYRQEGPLLEITSDDGLVCERTLTPFEQRFGSFMDRVIRATLLPDGSLILDSAGEQVEFDRVG
ncbi:META domain-containing protein [Brevundimonas viscosa]|uniref:Heat shock protein HslJ n=1 Tax=Brevundimonas viscosa TaxID=871741 RepID=A0A1I6T2J5_9CAUL|nr:META domain-containing protein [Brevundimonas viscosa]SFS83481.1 Heat shock protein HslJ [Brevundimonas viscosa]